MWLKIKRMFRLAVKIKIAVVFQGIALDCGLF